MKKEALTKKEHEMYMYLEENNITNSTYTALSKRMNINVNMVRNRILSLCRKGYLFRSGTLIELRKD